VTAPLPRATAGPAAAPAPAAPDTAARALVTSAPWVRLRVVPPPARIARSHQPRLPFVLLLAALLIGGLVGLLLLNTVLAQDAFALQRLQAAQGVLDDEEAALRAASERLDDPTTLGAAARALGMVPAGDPAFLQGTHPSGAVRPGVAAVRGGSRVGALLVVGAPRPPAPAPAPAPAPVPAAVPARAASPAHQSIPKPTGRAPGTTAGHAAAQPGPRATSPAPRPTSRAPRATSPAPRPTTPGHRP